MHCRIAQWFYWFSNYYRQVIFERIGHFYSRFYSRFYLKTYSRFYSRSHLIKRFDSIRKYYVTSQFFSTSTASYSFSKYDRHHSLYVQVHIVFYKLLNISIKETQWVAWKKNIWSYLYRWPLYKSTCIWKSFYELNEERGNRKSVRKITINNVNIQWFEEIKDSHSGLYYSASQSTTYHRIISDYPTIIIISSWYNLDLYSISIRVE